MIIANENNMDACDARALSVARAVYDAVMPETVILFGSRARGSYRPDSDIDLLLIVADQPKNREREQAARVAEDGVTPDGKRMAYQRLHYDEERRREEVALRLYDAEEHYAVSELAVTNNRGDQVVGYNAQQALDHSLKAMTAALGGRYTTTHNLRDLMAEVRATARAAGQDLGIALPERLAWLTEYAGGSKYDPKPQPIANRPALLDTVRRFQQAVAARLQISDTP